MSDPLIHNTTWYVDYYTLSNPQETLVKEFGTFAAAVDFADTLSCRCSLYNDTNPRFEITMRFGEVTDVRKGVQP
jgi:hypothetical protein